MRNLEIQLELTTKSHLTIGSEETTFLHIADIIQLRRINNSRKEVCIPATSFKGALRSSAIQIAHFITNDKNYCTNIDTAQLCSSGKRCIICSIFGANNTPSKIICEDCYPIKAKDFKTQVFTQTSIDRKRGRSKKGALFMKEQIPPEIKFETSLYGHNLDNNDNNDDKEQLLLLFALYNMNFCTIGNGNGLLEVKVNEIKNSNEKSELINKLLKKMGYK